MSSVVKTASYYYRTIGFRGLVSTIKSKITKAPVVLKTSRPEIRFPFYLRIQSSDVPTYEQVFIKQEYDFDVKKPPRIIVDAGANIGLASIYFANKFQDSLVIAVEPEDSNFAILEKNIAPYENIIPIHGALWSENKELDLVDPGLGKWGFMTQGNDNGEESLGDKCHRVNGMTVDRIMAEHGIESIDILKIDIEGAEREIFDDPSNWIGRVDSLIVELHEHMKSGCNRSFYNATNEFDEEWKQGENIYLTRSQGCLTKRAPH